MRHPSRTARDGHHETLLNQFFAEQASRRSPAVQRRYERVHQHLALFLAKADLSSLLTPYERAALDAERRLGGVFLDALGFDELVVCLPLFLSPDWRLTPAMDARAQVSLTGKLIAWLDDGDHFAPDMVRCAVYEAQNAVRSAQQLLRAPTPPAAAIRRAHLTLIHGGRLDT